MTGSQAPAYAVASVKDEIDIGQLSKMSIGRVRYPEFDGQGEELLLRHLADHPSNDVLAVSAPLPAFVSERAGSPTEPLGPRLQRRPFCRSSRFFGT